MTRKTFSDWVVRFWWIFPLTTILLIVAAYFVVNWDGSTIAMLILCSFAAFTLLLQLPVFIVLLLKKKWGRAVGAFFSGLLCLAAEVTIPLMAFALFIGGIFSMVPDDFGKQHPIPEGLEYSIPITDDDVRWNATDGYQFTPVDIDSADTASWLQIWNGLQGGIYHYLLYWPALEDGEIYLRCYEATENTALSENNGGGTLSKRTAIQVSNHDSFGPIGTPTQFTIYEGDWEDYYAVRVEVWHKPAHGKKHKLMQKTYRMEGWMR